MKNNGGSGSHVGTSLGGQNKIGSNTSQSKNIMNSFRNGPVK